MITMLLDSTNAALYKYNRTIIQIVILKNVSPFEDLQIVIMLIMDILECFVLFDSKIEHTC